MVIRVFDQQKNTYSSFALEELSYYMNRVFKTNIELVEEKEADIFVGLVNKEDRKDHVLISLDKGKGRIESNTIVGLLIGIYRMFHEFGVVYTRPGRRHDFVPELRFEDFLDKQLSIDETASYYHRGVCIEGADSFENILDFIDWLPKIGMNSFFIQFENPYSFLKRWYEHEFNPYLNKEQFSNELVQELSDRLDKELQKRGLIHHRVGHGWTGEVLGYSSKFGWESGLSISEEKKPYVAEINGKRELFNTAPILTSLDFSNPDVADKMVEIIKDYAKKRPDVNYLHVWLSDARNNICECENCRQELVSDQYIRILNQLDRALTSEGLDTKICFLLYHELLWAPQKEKLDNPERFTMMFAPITRTFEMSYADVDFDNSIPTPKPYMRNKIILPNSLEENLSYLFEWQKAFKGDSFVYDSPLGRAHYGDLGYMKISQTIYRDVSYLSNLHLNGYISCQELRAGFPHNFPNYVMGQMLWKKTRSYEELIEEYFSVLYGENWQSVVEYLEKLSIYSSCDYFNAIGSRQSDVLANHYYIAYNLADNFLPIIEENISKLLNSQKDEWKQLSYHREYVVKMAKALYLQATGKTRQAQDEWRNVLNYIRGHELLFQSNLDVYRVIEVAKNYAGFHL